MSEQEIAATLPFLAADLEQIREQAKNTDLDPDELGWLVYMAAHAEVVTAPAPGEPAGIGSAVRYTFNGEERVTVIGSYYLPERTTERRVPSTAPIAVHLAGAKPGDIIAGKIADRRVEFIILDVRPDTLIDNPPREGV